jgi:putative flavoprotein involved in K+ transport
VPRTPPQAERLAPRVRQLHAADYRSSEQLADGAVLVVGGGQSGCQIAEDLARAGRTVYLAASRVGRIPWSYRGRDSLAWLVDCGFWDQRPQDLPDPADTRLAIPLLAGGRSLDLSILAALGVRLLGHFATADGETVGFEGSPAEFAAFADVVAGRVVGLMDRWIAEQHIAAPDATAEPRETAPVPADSLPTLDLRAADVTTVVWSTGFTGDLSWAHLPLLAADGRPQHDGCATGVRGLWFVGFPWLTRRCSGIFHGFGRDADAVVDGVLRDLDS